MMDPAAALGEIAFWLERDLASPYKTKAFRKAQAIVEGMPAAEVTSRARAGTLKGVKGFGDTTLEVVTEAVNGEVPAYLADVRSRLDKPLTTGGIELRKQLRGDLHSHSDWTDGTTSIDLMASTAAWLGHEYLVLTDHSPHLTVANGLSADRLRDQLKEVARINKGYDDFTLLSGIEVDILDDGALDQTPPMLERLDIVVASVHSKLKMDKDLMTARMLAAIRNPHMNVLGHVTGRLVEGSRGTRPGSQFDAEAVFAACAENNVAVELNSRPERQDPPDSLLAMALDAGCLFSIDSDAHAPGQLALIDLGAARASKAGIPAERIVTTWPLSKLLDWSRKS